MRKQVLGVAAAALVVAVAWTGWRVHALSEEVARIEARPAAPAPVEPERTASARRDALEPPRLASVEPVSARDADGLAGLPADVAALRGRVEELERKEAAGAAFLKQLSAERMRMNEIAAIATSRNAISAAAQFQAAAKADADQDGTGEYGGFLEMAGAVQGRLVSKLNPPVLSSAFRELTQNGEAIRNGYLYRIYLPDSAGRGIGEPRSGFEASLVDADLAETTWCLYAWPEDYGATGTRTYFTNQGGDVMWTDARLYSGTGSGPAADAAFVEPGRITGSVAFGTGADGHVWKQAN